MLLNAYMKVAEVASEPQFNSLIEFELSEIIVTLANTLLIYLAFRFLLFDKVKKMLDKRNLLEIQKIQEADLAIDAAERKSLEIDERLDLIEDEASEKFKHTTDRANRRAETIIANANEQAKLINKKALDDIEREKKQAVLDVKKQISELVVYTASTLLEREVNDEDNDKILDEILLQTQNKG